MPSPSDASEKVLIIGAGIAGAATARCLADAGQPVTVLEAGTEPGAGGSGNPQGAVYIRPGLKDSPENRFALTALQSAIACYQHWQDHSDVPFWFPTGLLQLAWNENEQQRLRRFQTQPDYDTALFRPVSREQAQSLTGEPVTAGGLWFPETGWVRPDALCRVLLDHPNITWQPQTAITQVTKSAGPGWEAVDAQGQRWEATQLVLAAASASVDLLPDPLTLPLKPIRGQVSIIQGDDQSAPGTVLCADGYALPAYNGQRLIGASFDLGNPDPQVQSASHDDNRRRLLSWHPQGEKLWPEGTPAEGRVAFRAATPDYLPVAGRLWDPSALAAQIQRSPKLRGLSEHPECQTEGLYVLAGLGSKGLAYGPIIARHVAATILGQPPVLSRELADRVWPGRFAARALRRQR